MAMPPTPLPPAVTDSPVSAAEARSGTSAQYSLHPLSLTAHSSPLPSASSLALVVCSVPLVLLGWVSPVRPISAAGGRHSTACPSDES
jgi:hypothetical protein